MLDIKYSIVPLKAPNAFSPMTPQPPLAFLRGSPRVIAPQRNPTRKR